MCTVNVCISHEPEKKKYVFKTLHRLLTHVFAIQDPSPPSITSFTSTVSLITPFTSLLLLLLLLLIEFQLLLLKKTYIYVCFKMYVSHCTTLQHTATPCNALQHSAFDGIVILELWDSFCV